MPTERLDQALVSRGLVGSRTKAQRRIAQGDVLVNDVTIDKPATPVGEGDRLEVRGGDDFVGRGAYKLAAALDEWSIDAGGTRALDLGASTGGFTQVLLERGATHVVALDVGHGQLHPSLAGDERVLVVEGENARALSAARAVELGIEGISLVVADLSFISLTQVITAVVAAVGATQWVCLIKPQFEVGRERISHGIAKEADTHEQAILSVLAVAAESGLYPQGVMVSPITGEAGNREYLCWLSPIGRQNQTQWSLDIHSLTHS